MQKQFKAKDFMLKLTMNLSMLNDAQTNQNSQSDISTVGT